jgi:hypothetical protein
LAEIPGGPVCRPDTEGCFANLKNYAVTRLGSASCASARTAYWQFAGGAMRSGAAIFTGLPAGLLLLLVLGASVEDFPERFPYPLGASFADLARAFSGADADVLAGSRGAFAEIGAGFPRVQSSEITGRSGSALAQAPRSLGCASANVLTARAHILAGAGPSFLLILLRFVRRPGLRLGGPLILRWICGAREGGQTQEKGDARRHKNRGQSGLSFHFVSPADGFE